eukprot:jgi/Psemu1/9677/gm1.9677_g
MDSKKTNFNGSEPNTSGKPDTNPATNPPGKKTNKPNSNTKKPDNGKSTGHNQEELLKEILITEDATPKHFIELWKQLETMRGNKCVPKEMYQEELKIKAKEWIKYQQDMKKMAMYKLVCTQQQGMDAVSYVKTMKEHQEVLKSLEGSILCKNLMECEIQENIKYAAKYSNYKDYQNTPPLLRKAIGKAIKQKFLETIIVKGSDKDTSDLKKTLANNYSLLNDQYPSTTATTLDMLNMFKSTSKAKVKEIPIPLQPIAQTTAFTTTGTEGTNTTQFASNETNHQLLVHAMEGGEDFGGEYHQFVQLGIKSDDTGPAGCNVEPVGYLFITNGMDRTHHKHHSDNECLISTLKALLLVRRTGVDDSTYGDSDDNESCANNSWTTTKTETVHDDWIINNATSDVAPHNSSTIEHLKAQQNKSNINPNWILLDSKSSINLVTNQNMVENIKEAPNGKYMTIHCNSGKGVTNYYFPSESGPLGV